MTVLTVCGVRASIGSAVRHGLVAARQQRRAPSPRLDACRVDVAIPIFATSTPRTGRLTSTSPLGGSRLRGPRTRLRGVDGTLSLAVRGAHSPELGEVFKDVVDEPWKPSASPCSAALHRRVRDITMS